MDVPILKRERLADWDQIVLGTVQLGRAYGRRRHKHPLNDGVVYEIIDRAWTLGVQAFDTAETYGSAAARLLNWLQKTSNLDESVVVTKVSPSLMTEKRVTAACQQFEGARSITLLSHGPLRQRRFSKLRTWAAALDVGVGQSVYTVAEVQAAARAGATRVQAPVNVLDYRQLLAAHKSKIPIDARSIFLQGLLLDTPAAAERRVYGAGVVAQAVQTAARTFGLPTATALLAGVLVHLGVHDRVVIGIDAPDQLDDVASALNAPAHLVEAFLSTLADLLGPKPAVDHLLDARTWPLAKPDVSIPPLQRFERE